MRANEPVAGKPPLAGRPFSLFMTLFEQATQADVNQDLRAAVHLYEQCAQADAPATTREVALLNLLVLYWHCTFDYGVYSSLLADGFTELELAHMYQRKTEIEQVLTAILLPSCETRFWVSYIQEEETYGDVSAAPTIAQLLQDCPEQALAAYYLVDRAAPRVMNPSAAGAPPWALVRVAQLQEELAHEPQTFKNRYLLNHIESLLHFHRL